MVAWQRALVPALLAMVAYALIASFGDISDIMAAASALSVPLLLVVLGLSLLNYALRAWRWVLLLRIVGREPRAKATGAQPGLGRGMLYYTAGLAGTVTPGKAGELIRGVYLARHGIKWSTSVASLFVDRFLDLIVILALASLAAGLVSANPPLIVGLATLSFVGAVAALYLRVPHLVALAVCRRLRHRARRLFLFGLNCLRTVTAMLKGPSLVWAGVLGVVAWAAEGVGFFLICEAMGIQIDLLTAIGLYSIALIGGTLTMMPAGLVGTEAILVFGLMACGSDESTALAASLVCRVATLWFAVVLGAMVLLGLRLGNGGRTDLATATTPLPAVSPS